MMRPSKDPDANNSVSVMITFWGDNLVPDAITRATGITPTSYSRKGDARSSREENTSKHKVGHWSLCSSEYTDSNSIEEHLYYIEEFMKTNFSKINEMPSIDSARVSVIFAMNSVPGDSSSWHGEFSREFISLTSLVNAELHVVVAW